MNLLEQLKKLAEKWHSECQKIAKYMPSGEPQSRRIVLDECAGELKALLAQPQPLALTEEQVLLKQMAKAMYAVHRRLEFYTEREINHPANHQEFAREAQVELDAFNLALTEYNEWAKRLTALAASTPGAGTPKCPVYSEFCKPGTDIKLRFTCVRPEGHREPHAYELPVWPSNQPAPPSQPAAEDVPCICFEGRAAVCPVHNLPPSEPAPSEPPALTPLWEIAAQLAELNEKLRDDKSAINVALCATNDDIPVRVRP